MHRKYKNSDQELTQALIDPKSIMPFSYHIQFEEIVADDSYERRVEKLKALVHSYSAYLTANYYTVAQQDLLK